MVYWLRCGSFVVVLVVLLPAGIAPARRERPTHAATIAAIAATFYDVAEHGSAAFLAGI
jgi:hypothetical protein